MPNTQELLEVEIQRLKSRMMARKEELRRNKANLNQLKIENQQLAENFQRHQTILTEMDQRLYAYTYSQRSTVDAPVKKIQEKLGRFG